MSLLRVWIIFQIAFISWLVLVVFFFKALFSSPCTHAVVIKRSVAWTHQKVCVTWFIRKLRGTPHLFPLGKCFVRTSPSARPSLCSLCLPWLFPLDVFPHCSGKLEDFSSFKCPHPSACVIFSWFDSLECFISMLIQVQTCCLKSDFRFKLQLSNNSLNHD